jgi:hypothetical protein
MPEHGWRRRNVLPILSNNSTATASIKQRWIWNETPRIAGRFFWVKGVTGRRPAHLAEGVASVPATYQVHVRQVQLDILLLGFRELLFNEVDLVRGVHVLSLLVKFWRLE